MERSEPVPLVYQGRQAEVRPARWWLLWLFGAVVLGGNALSVRPTPPGWPITRDYVLMLLIPVGGIILSLLSRIPGRAIGIYGLLSAWAFLFFGALSNTRLGLRLGDSHAFHTFLLHWCLFIFGSWAFCRGCVVLRRGRK